MLQPGRYPALKSWGPNFFTKYLYFAGAGVVGHPSLIVDARVLATLFKETGNPAFQPGSTNYPVGTYLAAIEVMRTWAAELSSPERTVGADEVERWAFGAGRDGGNAGYGKCFPGAKNGMTGGVLLTRETLLNLFDSPRRAACFARLRRFPMLTVTAALGGVVWSLSAPKPRLHGFPVSDVVKALYEGFPAFSRIVGRSSFVRQLFRPSVGGIDVLALGFVGPFGFCKRLAG